MNYSEKLKDPRWQRKRLEVLQRDGFRCRNCGSDKSTLHVHHCCYNRGEPWEIHSAHLITLCESCHERRHSIEKRARAAFEWLLHLADTEEKLNALAAELDLHDLTRGRRNKMRKENATT